MRTLRRKCRGFMLVTVLVISVVLLVIGLAFLGFISNDYFFSGKLHNNTRAFYLAWAGMQYYTAQGLPAADSQGNLTLQLQDSQHLCIVVPGTNLTFRGLVTDGYGRVLAERDLIAPGGNLSLWYEATR